MFYHGSINTFSMSIFQPSSAPSVAPVSRPDLKSVAELDRLFEQKLRFGISQRCLSMVDECMDHGGVVFSTPSDRERFAQTPLRDKHVRFSFIGDRCSASVICGKSPCPLTDTFTQKFLASLSPNQIGLLRGGTRSA